MDEKSEVLCSHLDKILLLFFVFLMFHASLWRKKLKSIVEKDIFKWYNGAY